jgi:hypothetical protein
LLLYITDRTYSNINYHFFSGLGASLNFSDESAQSNGEPDREFGDLLDLLKELVVLADLLRAGVVLQ